MNQFLAAYGAKLVYLFGISNVACLLLVLLSCRCMMGVRMFANLMQYAWYKRFYTLHCYYWWAFIISVFLHTLLAFTIFGNPFS